MDGFKALVVTLLMIIAICMVILTATKLIGNYEPSKAAQQACVQTPAACSASSGN